MKIFSTFTPNKTYKSAQAIAAEPAPETTNFTSSAFYLLILKRLIMLKK
jgi:hypothetical protein